VRSKKGRVLAVAAGAAVVMGMGGGAAVARDMVTGEEIRNHSIEGRDMERNSVGPFHLRPEGVRGHHLADGTVRWQDLAGYVQDRVGSAGEDGARGPKGEPGDDGVSGYSVFTSTQDFGPGGIGGAWCGAPDANTEDQGWRVVGGGATLTPEDVDAGVSVVSSWPNLSDPLNPGWSVQLNKPTNVNPGEVELYAVCIKAAEELETDTE